MNFSSNGSAHLLTPKGIFGIAYERPHRLDSIITNIRKMLQRDEEQLICIKSRDERAVLGYIGSKITPYQAAISSDQNRDEIGVFDGFLFSHSFLDSEPHKLLSFEGSLRSIMNGMFCCAAYSNGTLKVFADPWSTLPVYYHCSASLTAFSTSLDIVIELAGLSDMKPSDEGMAQYFSWGRILNGATIFNDVSKLNSGECLIRSGPAAPLLTRYYEPIIEPSQVSMDDVVDAFIQANERILSRTNGNVISSVTGGLDSRCIAAVMHRLKPDISTVTHYMSGGVDLEIAKKLVTLLSLHHRTFEIGDEFRSSFKDYLECSISASNGLITACEAHGPYIWQRYGQLGTFMVDGNNTFMDGRWTLKTSAYRIKNKTDFESELWTVLRGLSLDWILPDSRRKQYISIARDVLAQITPDPDRWFSAGCAADAFRSRYLIGNLSVDAALLNNHYIRYVSPYMDLDYVDLLTNVHPKLRFREIPQQAILQRFDPRLLRLERSHKDIKTFPFRNNILALLPVAAAKLLGKSESIAMLRPLAEKLRFERPTMKNKPSIQMFKGIVIRENRIYDRNKIDMMPAEGFSSRYYDRMFRVRHVLSGASMINKYFTV